MPADRERGWATCTSSASSRPAGGDPMLAAVRASAVIRRGTRMIKVLSARQLAGYVGAGCRTASATASTTWRTCAPRPTWRCCAPTGRHRDGLGRSRSRCAGGPSTRPTTRCRSGRRLHRGLIRMPPARPARPAGARHRLRAQRPAPHPGVRHPRTWPTCRCRPNAALVAYPADGTEVVLYTYLRRAARAGCGWSARSGGTCWPRCRARRRTRSTARSTRAGHPAGRHATATSRVRGGGRPAGRVPGAGPMTRAARYPVDALARRTSVRDLARRAAALVLGEDGDWLPAAAVPPGRGHGGPRPARSATSAASTRLGAGREATDDARDVDLAYAL